MTSPAIGARVRLAGGNNYAHIRPMGSLGTVMVYTPDGMINVRWDEPAQDRYEYEQNVPQNYLLPELLPEPMQARAWFAEAQAQETNATHLILICRDFRGKRENTAYFVYPGTDVRKRIRDFGRRATTLRWLLAVYDMSKSFDEASVGWHTPHTPERPRKAALERLMELED